MEVGTEAFVEVLRLPDERLDFDNLGCSDRIRAFGERPGGKFGVGDRIGEHTSAPLRRQPARSADDASHPSDGVPPGPVGLHLAEIPFDLERVEGGDPLRPDDLSDVPLPDLFVAPDRLRREIRPTVVLPALDSVVDRRRRSPGPVLLFGDGSRNAVLDGDESGELAFCCPLAAPEHDAALFRTTVVVTTDEHAQLPGVGAPVFPLTNGSGHRCPYIFSLPVPDS
jgi:hypothetical protein